MYASARSCGARPNSGFTLIELTVVILVLAIIAAVMAPLMANSFRAYETNQSNLVTLSKLRYATERMAREVREVRFNGTNYQITMGLTSLSFTKNDAANTVVTITAAPPLVTLQYSVPPMSATLTDQVGALQFRYFNIDNIETASNVDVAYVDMELTLNDPNSVPAVQRTRVALRNR